MSKATAMVAEAEILRFEREVNEGLRRLHRRKGYEPASYDFPLRHVVEPESGELDEWVIRKDSLRTFFEYLLADGPETWNVVRRLFALGAHMGIEPFSLLNVRERALLLGNSHGAQHWMTKRLVAALERNGALSTKAPGQKGKAASAAASKAQLGNKNRVSSTGAAEPGRKGRK